MAHAIEIVDGKASMAFVGERMNIWHRLGTQLPEGAGAEEIAIAAGINWSTRTEAVYLANGMKLDNVRAIIRADENKVLGIATDDYVPISNLEVFEAMSEWIKDGRLRFTTAGSLFGGKKVWGQALIGEDFLVAGTDRIRPYVLASMGHDGKTGITIKKTVTRVVCANTESAAMRENGDFVTIRHTGSAREQVANADKALGLIAKSIANENALFERLAQWKCSEELREQAFDIVVPPLEPDATYAQQKNRAHQRQHLALNWAHSATVALLDRDSRWGVYNAVTEFVDHTQQRNGQNATSSNADALQRRAVYSIDGKGAETRSQVLNLLSI